jgi:predicted nuclease of restriction endonuclease-like RecB superfamily
VVVRVARLRGLLCVVSPAGGDPPGARLDVSGPLALFRRTTLYGHALASLLPALTWCDRFRMRAAVAEGSGARWLEIGSGDPLWLPAEVRRFDSAVEARFAADFAAAAPDWDVVREPQPVVAGGTLVVPDFALVHRRDPERRWLLEVVGFWTPDYLAKKLARLREAGLSRLILCIDEARACGAAELPPAAAIVRYRRRIDAGEVLRLVEAG